MKAIPFKLESESAHGALKKRVQSRLMQSLDLAQAQRLPETQLRAECFREADRLIGAEQAPLTNSEKRLLVQEVLDDIFGLGPIEPLLRDLEISDILINGPNSVYVERQGRLERVAVSFRDDHHLINIITRIANKVGRRIDESTPMLDARLQDGSRVNAIIPPLSLNGACLSIRRFVGTDIGIDDLIKFESMDARMGELLQAAVRAKLNVVISGGAGSGKTTLLNALSGHIPEGERIVTIEDTAELRIQRDHVVCLETRPPNIEGQGAVAQRDLLKNCLRMRPDRIIIGEVRGDEALDMLQAMNTGHEGSMTTIHANTVQDATGRLLNMVKLSGIEYPTQVIREQIASTLDVIVQLSRTTGGKRKIMSISEVDGMDGSRVRVRDIFAFRQRGIDDRGNAHGSFAATGRKPAFYLKMETEGVAPSPTLFEPDRQ